MALGPGKYDDLATYVRTQAQAGGVIVIVFDGDNGSGFAAQGDIYMHSAVPAILRTLADQIEQDIRPAPGEQTQ